MFVRVCVVSKCVCVCFRVSVVVFISVRGGVWCLRGGAGGDSVG